MKKTIIALFLCLTIGCGVCAPNLIANAESKKVPYESSVCKDNTKIENIQTEKELNFDNNKYSSQLVVEDKLITMSRDEKRFNYRLGTIYSDLDGIYVTDDDNSIEIEKYNWYSVDNGNILMADVVEGIDCYETPYVVSISIYIPNSYLFAVHNMFDIDYNTNNILELLYVNEDYNVCTKIIAPLANEVYSELESLSSEFELSRENTDKVSEVLIESVSFESAFKSQMYDEGMQMKSLSEQDVQNQLMSLPSYGSYANSNQTVRLNAYDDWTDYDKYIDEYETTYKDKVSTFISNGVSNKVSDDPIVNIIPKSLFRYRGVYSYIGKEYGFYVKTIQNYQDDNISEFIVFDIETVVPYPGRSANDPRSSVTIRPAFSGKINYYSAWGGVVTYYSYADPYLALANIQVAGAINNIYEKNIGDTGYSAYDDYGYAFDSYGVTAVGTGLKRDNAKVDLGWLKTTFGAAKILNNAYPGVGTAVSVLGKSLTSVLDLSINHYYSSNRTQYSSMIKDGNNYKTGYVVFGNSNTLSMINSYGNLVKGFETEMLDSGKAKEEDIPLLYKTSDHYLKAEYTFCQQDSKVNWDALVAINIALDIYTDTTKYNLWVFKAGEFTKRDSVTGGRVDYYNELPSSSNGGSISEGVLYHTEFSKDNSGTGKTATESYTPCEGSYKDFYFTPNRTFTYVIETLNRSTVNADPYLKIYDSSDKLITSNDDGGMPDSLSSSVRNAKIRISLNGGTTYKIRTLCYSYNSGYFEFIIRKDATLNESTYDKLNATNTEISNDAIWYTFVPKSTGTYSFYTVGSSDTYLSLYDSMYSRYSYNDDGGTGRNALIDMYMIKGQTYYLKVNCFGMGSGTFNVYANRQRIAQVHNVSHNAEYKYSMNAGETNFFRITPSETAFYTIKTRLESGNPKLELYDENMNLIAYDDNGGSGNNAWITYDLRANKTYYIKLNQVYSETGWGSLDLSY